MDVFFNTIIFNYGGKNEYSKLERKNVAKAL